MRPAGTKANLRSPCRAGTIAAGLRRLVALADRRGRETHAFADDAAGVARAARMAPRSSHAREPLPAARAGEGALAYPRTLSRRGAGRCDRARDPGARGGGTRH